MRSLIVRENLVRKVDFPRLAVPLACVLQASLNLGLNLIPVFDLPVRLRRPRAACTWLELPLILLLLLVFTTGASLLLSALFVRYRDVEPIWDVVLQALFYATPILYSLTIVIDKAGIEVARLMLVSPTRDRDPAGAPCADRSVVRERGADLRHPVRRPDPDRLRRGDLRRGDVRVRARRAARRRGPVAAVRGRGGTVLRWTAIVAALVAFSAYATWPLVDHMGEAVYEDDPFTYTWDLWWVARSLVHLDNPWWSSWVLAPYGSYLGFHTLSPLLGLIAAPLTLIAGPLASFNILKLLLGPAAALAAYVMGRSLGLPKPACVGDRRHLGVFDDCDLAHRIPHEPRRRVPTAAAGHRGRRPL